MSDNPNFVPMYSTNNIYRDEDDTICLEDELDAIEADILGKANVDHTHSGYATSDHVHSNYAVTSDIETLQTAINGKADSGHTHTEYALQSDLELLEDVVDGKSDSTHTHDYAPTNHSHTEYATTESLDTLEAVVEGKANANHTHSNYASVSHTHTEYAEASHSHNNYSLTSHTHSNYALATDLTSLEGVVEGKANANHSHNYAEVDHDHSSEYADINHNHSGTYAVVAHNHDEDYAEIDHVHTEYSAVGHDHDEDYAPLSHSHTDYATVTSLNELSATVSGKANASHNHNTEYYTQSQIDTKLSAKSDSTHNHNSAYDAIGSASDALTESKAYTDSKIDALVGTGASTTLDTIGEISSAIEDNQDAIDLLNSAIANKANSSDLTSHTNNSTIHVTNDNKNNWNTAYTHSQTAHAPSSAEPNQNAFSNVKVGSTTIAADSKTDTLTFVAGSNITLTPDATGDSITIASTNTVYTHPTTAGNKHIPAGGSSGQVLKWSADGTAVWGNDNNTTYSNATQTASGLMSDTDKVKLDGIAVGANNYTLPSAGTNLGGVKSGGDVTISAGVITVNDDSHNHVISNIDGLQSALDGKASSSHTHSDVYTESEVDTLLSGKANSSHTHSIANITNLQSTLDGKANSSHGTHVSYSTTAPVMDGTASVGTASTVARSDHKHPTDTSRAAQTSLDSHTGNKSNPHGVTLSQLGLTATAAELNVLDGITATVTELNYVDGVTSAIQTQLNSKATSGHTHNYAGSSSAGGAATSANKLNTDAGSVTQPVYFANGIPVKTTYTLGASVPSGAKFTDTTYGAVTTSANGLMIASDKSKLDGMVLATVTEVETYLGI